MSAIQNVLQRYWGFAALLLWGGLLVIFDLLRLDPYGLNEQAARTLLLIWSASDNIINPIGFLGAPDMRALLYLPAGIYWPGNMLAIKLLTALYAFIAITLLYHWIKKTESAEAAMLACALLIISPMMITQIDQLQAGPFLLLGFLVGSWLDDAYRAKPRYFGGWYFSQLLMVFVIVSIHPLGLAYPLAIALRWFTQKDQHKKSLHVHIGLLIALVLGSIFMNSDITLFSNPIAALSNAALPSPALLMEGSAWLPGIILGLLLVLIIIVDLPFLRSNLFAQMLLLASLIGVLLADGSWALIASTLVISRGIVLLIRFNSGNRQGLMAQRGLVLAASFVVATFFMLQDKSHAIQNKLQVLSPVDELIENLARKASEHDQAFRAYSQWPARTMLACRREVFPLSPRIADDPQLSENLVKMTHLIFNPFDPVFKPLSDKLAHLTDLLETTVFLSSGVILTVRKHEVELNNYRPPVEQAGDAPATDKPEGS